MNTLKKIVGLFEVVGRLVSQCVGFYLPRTLPQGLTEFDALVSRLMTRYPMPTDDEASIRFGLASMVMHLGPLESRKADSYFVKAIRAGAAKQVAGAVFQDIKDKQKQYQRLKAEATAKAQETASGNAQSTAS